MSIRAERERDTGALLTQPGVGLKQVTMLRNIRPGGQENELKGNSN